jgi:hypothetical protein
MAHLFLVKPEPPLVRDDDVEFAAFLQTARVIWRFHPELVEASSFPHGLRAAYAEYSARDPDQGQCSDYCCPCKPDGTCDFED